jgi:hypothetical protein
MPFGLMNAPGSFQNMMIKKRFSIYKSFSILLHLLLQLLPLIV